MMLSLVDELLVPHALFGREDGVDFRPHFRLDRVEPRTNLRPEGIGLGPVAREDRADGVALRAGQIELAAQVGDHRVGPATLSPSSAARTLTLGGFMAAPAGETTG